MAGTRQAPDVVRFGEFELDLRTGELVRDHRRVLLPEQPFRLLALLIRERGALVTRETLGRELWSDDTFVDFEAGLNAAVKRLREALGDAAASPTFIETLPRRGYRFIAQVEEGSVPGPAEGAVPPASPAVQLPASPSPEPGRTGRTGPIPALVLAGAGVGVVLLAVLGLRPRTPSGGGMTAAQPGMTRLTNLGTVRKAAASPEGDVLAFVRDEDGRQSLWVRRTGNADPTRILGPLDGSFESITLAPGGTVYYTFFSPDRTNRALLRLPIAGGKPEEVLEAAGGISFSPDGTRFAYVHSLSMTLKESRVVLVEARGGHSRVLTARKTPESYVSLEPSWSPDGTRVALFEATDAEPGRHRLVEADVESGATRLLADLALAEVKGALWRPGGREIIVSGRERRSTALRLWSVSPGSPALRPLTGDVSDYTPFGWSSPGTEILAIRLETSRAIWTAETANPQRARRVTEDAGSLHGFDEVAWAPDGELLYTLTESDNADVWGIDPDTQRRRRLTSDPADDYGPIVSPDGGTVVFASNRGGIPGLWAMGRDGREPRRLTTGGDAHASFSPDGEWVAFQRSGVESTPWAVFRVFLRTGEVLPITVPATMRPSVSPDGRFVAHYWMTPDRWALAVTPVEGGLPARTFALRPTHAERLVRWAADGTGLAFIDQGGGASNLWLQPFPEGAPRQLTSFPEGSIDTFDWSRDGTKLAFMRVREVRDVVAIDLGPAAASPPR